MKANDSKAPWKIFVVIAVLFGNLVLANGCSGDPVFPLRYQQRVSGCGGFELKEDNISEARADSYSDAEVLYWTYDRGTKILEIRNESVSLNCCGENSIEIELVDKVYTIREKSAPKPPSGWCRCKCMFDFAATIEAIPQGRIRLNILRGIENKWRPVWEGTLDLSALKGTAVVNGKP
ncbi:MAG: hypothetical protein HKM93_01620 [Desulfobacteraceae bacterium]|nr:hypothetical protein [Desulfobacteraceae bacterium]